MVKTIQDAANKLFDEIGFTLKYRIGAIIDVCMFKNLVTRLIIYQNPRACLRAQNITQTVCRHYHLLLFLFML